MYLLLLKRFGNGTYSVSCHANTIKIPDSTLDFSENAERTDVLCASLAAVGLFEVFSR